MTKKGKDRLHKMKTSQKLQINTEMWLPSYQMKKLKENNNKISGWDRMLKTKQTTHTYSWTLSDPSLGSQLCLYTWWSPAPLSACTETHARQYKMHCVQKHFLTWCTQKLELFGDKHRLVTFLFLRSAQEARGTRSTPKTKQSGMEFWLPKQMQLLTMGMIVVQ